MDFTKLTAYMDSLKEGYGVPGLDIQVMKDHKVIYRYMTGYSDYACEVPISQETMYDIYSCTKVLTMVAVMQLVEQGKLSLQDPLEKYIPEFGEMTIATDFVYGNPPFLWPTQESPTVPAKNKIYIHQLMSMTAGLSYNSTGEPVMELAKSSGGTADTLDLVRAMAKMPLLYEPGTRFLYSLGHDVLAAVVQTVSGMPFRDYMQKKIFGPLEVTDMFYHVPEDQRHRVADQYVKDEKTGKLLPTEGLPFRFTKNYDSGGAGLTCTVESYSKVIDALACGGLGANGNRILSTDSIHTMSKNWLTEAQMDDFRKMGKAGYGYGLGVRTLIDPDSSWGPVGEFGWDGAAGAYSVIDPFSHISIFYVHEILEMPTAYSEIHPTIRDLVYEALGL